MHLDMDSGDKIRWLPRCTRFIATAVIFHKTLHNSKEIKTNVLHEDFTYDQRFLRNSNFDRIHLKIISDLGQVSI